jgi:hypothetical protein
MSKRADGQVNFYQSNGEAQSRAFNHFPIVGESVLRFALPNCEEKAPQSCPGLPLMVISGLKVVAVKLLGDLRFELLKRLQPPLKYFRLHVPSLP